MSSSLSSSMTIGLGAFACGAPLGPGACSGRGAGGRAAPDPDAAGARAAGATEPDAPDAATAIAGALPLTHAPQVHGSVFSAPPPAARAWLKRLMIWMSSLSETGGRWHPVKMQSDHGVRVGAWGLTVVPRPRALAAYKEEFGRGCGCASAPSAGRWHWGGSCGVRACKKRRTCANNAQYKVCLPLFGFKAHSKEPLQLSCETRNVGGTHHQSAQFMLISEDPDCELENGMITGVARRCGGEGQTSWWASWPSHV